MAATATAQQTRNATTRKETSRKFNIKTPYKMRCKIAAQRVDPRRARLEFLEVLARRVKIVGQAAVFRQAGAGRRAGNFQLDVADSVGVGRKNCRQAVHAVFDSVAIPVAVSGADFLSVECCGNLNHKNPFLCLCEHIVRVFFTMSRIYLLGIFPRCLWTMWIARGLCARRNLTHAGSRIK